MLKALGAVLLLTLAVLAANVSPSRLSSADGWVAGQAPPKASAAAPGPARHA